MRVGARLPRLFCQMALRSPSIIKCRSRLCLWSSRAAGCECRWDEPTANALPIVLRFDRENYHQVRSRASSGLRMTRRFCRPACSTLPNGCRGVGWPAGERCWRPFCPQACDCRGVHEWHPCLWPQESCRLASPRPRNSKSSLRRQRLSRQRNSRGSRVLARPSSAGCFVAVS